MNARHDADKELPPKKEFWDHSKMVLVYYEANPEFERFTGLTDSKGQKIFEGDILAENYTAEMAALGSDAHVGDVYFDSGAFLIRGGGTLFDLTYSVTPNIVDGYSVVGNIHQNPELL